MTSTRDPRQQMIPARLEGRQEVHGNPHLGLFRIAPREGALPPFEAGQVARLAWERDGEVEQRMYSMASAPEEEGYVEFYVVDAQDGKTSHLFELPENEPMWLSPPTGKFTLANHGARHLALVGADAAVAPYRSMVRHLLRKSRADEDFPEAVSVWHGVGSADQLAFRDAFEALEDEAPFRFLYVPCVHGVDAPDDVHRGRVADVLAKALGLRADADATFAAGTEPDTLRDFVPVEHSQILVCGDPLVIQAVTEAAADTPWEGRIASERWW